MVKEFNITHIPAGTALTFQPVRQAEMHLQSTLFDLGSLVGDNIHFQWTRATVRGFCHGHCQPNRIYYPTGLDPTTFPVYSGFIHISNQNESYQIAYFGVVGSLIDVQVVDNTNTIFGVPLPTVIDGSRMFQNGAENYSFVGNDFPGVVWRLVFGTPLFRLDLVDSIIQLNTTLNRRDNSPVLDRETFHFETADDSGTFAAVLTKGILFQNMYLPRNTNTDPQQPDPVSSVHVDIR